MIKEILIYEKDKDVLTQKSEEVKEINDEIKQLIQDLKDKFANSPALNGKPDKIKESILAGMLRKELSNNVLTEQEYVVESGKTVAQYLKEINATELEMIRYEVGEGIEKVEVDFASEVAAQMKK